MAGYDDFWTKAGPGLLDFGLGAITRNQGQQEAADKLGTAQGPLYQDATNAARGMFTQLGSADPQAFAKQRFDAQQALVAPVQDKQFDDLYRKLYAKGQLGIADYNPGVEGITPNGTAMNPQLAAFFAAKNAQRSKDAYGAMDQGQKYIGDLVSRAGMLQRTAAGAQGTGLEAQRTQPSRAASNSELLRGVSGVLKNAGGFAALPGAIRSASDAFGVTQPGGPGIMRTATDAIGMTRPNAAPAPAPTPMAGGFDLGGGMNVDQFGNVAGGTPYTFDDGGGTQSAGGMFDLGSGMNVDEYGNVAGGTPYDFGNSADSFNFDVPNFDLSQYFSPGGGFDFSSWF